MSELHFCARDHVESLAASLMLTRQSMEATGHNITEHDKAMLQEHAQRMESDPETSSSKIAGAAAARTHGTCDRASRAIEGVVYDAQAAGRVPQRCRLSRAEPCRAVPSRAEPCRDVPRRAEP